jgi:hypothetical protein
MMRALAIALLLLLALLACDTTKTAFVPGVATAAVFDQDSADCELRGEEKRTFGGLGGLAGVAMYSESFNRVYTACMRAKGYQPTP